MSDLVTFERRGAIGVITVDNPPVNALSPGVPEGLVDCVTQGNADPKVKAMVLRGAGFEVIDLGVDTSADEFIAAVEEHHANLVGMSALLTTTMPNMGKTIEAFIDEDIRDDVKIMVGGAPVTQEFADDMGADGYGKDALACVELAKSLLEEAARDTGL